MHGYECVLSDRSLTVFHTHNAGDFSVNAFGAWSANLALRTIPLLSLIMRPVASVVMGLTSPVWKEDVSYVKDPCSQILHVLNRKRLSWKEGMRSRGELCWTRFDMLYLKGIKGLSDLEPTSAQMMF